jgi:hypothetical protein
MYVSCSPHKLSASSTRLHAVLLDQKNLSQARAGQGGFVESYGTWESFSTYLEFLNCCNILAPHHWLPPSQRTMKVSASPKANKI